MESSDEVILYEREERSNPQPVAFDELEDVQSSLSRSQIVDPMITQQLSLLALLAILRALEKRVVSEPMPTTS